MSVDCTARFQMFICSFKITCYHTLLIFPLAWPLQCVELISADLSSEHTPSLVSPQGTRRYERRTQEAAMLESQIVLPEGMEGTEWAVRWRCMVRQVESGAVALPLPKNNMFFVNLKEMFKSRLSQQQQAPLHK